jgi:2-oxoglutarate ferredoxin oxidoreductase subunit delta
MISVDEELCKGCGLCIVFCPAKALKRSKKLNKRGVYPPELVHESKCNECRFCELICPDFAINVK